MHSEGFRNDPRSGGSELGPSNLYGNGRLVPVTLTNWVIFMEPGPSGLSVYPKLGVADLVDGS